MICNPEDLLTVLPDGGALLGLDLGSKTIGVAVSDATWMVASPIHVIKRKKFTLDLIELQEILSQKSIKGIVIGLPLNMDGTEGPRVQSTRAFVRNLERDISLPIVFWDERLSSQQADKAMLEGDLSRKKRASRIDALAACVILQSALDRFRNL